MPIYKYKCQKCGHQFEELVLGEEEVECSQCGHKNLKKLPTSFSVGSSHSSSSCSGGVCNLAGNCPTCGNN